VSPAGRARPGRHPARRQRGGLVRARRATVRAAPTLPGRVEVMMTVKVHEFSGRRVTPVKAYGQRALTAATTFVSESLASPNNSVVFGSNSRSLSMPANPGRMERFMNTMLRASSTARIGIP